MCLSLDDETDLKSPASLELRGAVNKQAMKTSPLKFSTAEIKMINFGGIAYKILCLDFKNYWQKIQGRVAVGEGYKGWGQ